ncbi:prolyl oligopeptidase family serine peptidase [Promineifilum sp.]|uniref:S9 family peptidase n=1 Tax=Promineifilum sp. TaxID=2664178 RepID=UPI0035B3F82D
MQAARIESLLSARLFQAPQIVGDRLFFASNLGGCLSLYAMDRGGSVPEPLLPPGLALQNPHLVARLFQVYPKLGKILLMLDHNGDENYQPMFIPLDGGYPEPALGDTLSDYRCQLDHYDTDQNLAYFFAESRNEPLSVSFRADLATGEVTELFRSMYEAFVAGSDSERDRLALVEGYTAGDSVLYLWEPETGEARLLNGRRLEEREPGEEVPLTSFGAAEFTRSGRGLLLMTSLFEDTYGLGYIALAEPETVARVQVRGQVHEGLGEMENLKHLRDDRYALQYNIDGCSWLYEGVFDEATLEMSLERVICGQGELAGGVMDSFYYDKANDRFVLSFSTATSPTQLYTVEGPSLGETHRQTRERVLGLPQEHLSAGEDASFTSHDGLRVSARLYLPSPALGFEGPRPLVYYVHGGPQGQERPDFAWFSMPLIQFLTLNGFAVFVPNARGSTGYGLSYMKHVDRDWGGQDRLDHVHAMKLLADDARLDVGRAGVVGRSYGGYMTLTLATRHPELWSAAVDMFGPYDLLTFTDRVPETWKPYFAIAVGDPVKDKAFLVERSPRHYVDDIQCPLLVIQGKNDPRVIEQESRDVVEHLRQRGKEVDYLMFPDEGHDVLKYENRVHCYNTITDFFRKHLMNEAT